MSEISTLRLYLLRGMYLLIALGMGVQIWPLILVPGADVSHMGGVVRAMLGALTLLCLWGVQHPVRMLPLLLFEFAWKLVWVLAFGLEPWLAGELDAGRQETLFACVLGIVLVPMVIPWGFVIRHYFRGNGEPWRFRGQNPQT